MDRKNTASATKRLKIFNMKKGDRVHIDGDVVVVDYVPSTHMYVLSTDPQMNADKWARKSKYLPSVSEFEWPAWASPFNIPRILGFEMPKYEAKKDADGIYHKTISGTKYILELDPDFDNTGKYYFNPINRKAPRISRVAEPIRPSTSINNQYNAQYSGQLFTGTLLRIFKKEYKNIIYFQEIGDNPSRLWQAVIFIPTIYFEHRLPAHLLTLQQ